MSQLDTSSTREAPKKRQSSNNNVIRQQKKARHTREASYDPVIYNACKPYLTSKAQKRLKSLLQECIRDPQKKDALKPDIIELIHRAETYYNLSTKENMKPIVRSSR